MIKLPQISFLFQNISKRNGISIFLLLAIISIASNVFAQNDVSRSGNAEIEISKPTENAKNSSASIDKTESSSLAIITEGFEGGGLPIGWSVQNRSTVIGTNTNCWNLFTTTPWAAQAGTGHFGANFNCTTGNNTISGWLIGPNVTFNNGDQITFYTRKGTPDNFADRLELRLSTNGASTNVGTTSTSVGDFTNLLLSVNPTLVTGVYPTTFTQFTATISGLAGPTSGRFAFRYFITSGGPSGTNSDIISIDTVTYPTVTTAANATVGGYVLNAKGNGVLRATVQMTDQNGNIRTAHTNNFGYYRFEAVEVGSTYVFNVSAKQHQFVPQVINVQENLQELNFTAQ